MLQEIETEYPSTKEKTYGGMDAQSYNQHLCVLVCWTFWAFCVLCVNVFVFEVYFWGICMQVLYLCVCVSVYVKLYASICGPILFAYSTDFLSLNARTNVGVDTKVKTINGVHSCAIQKARTQRNPDDGKEREAKKTG